MKNRIVGVLWAREKEGMEYYSGVLHDLHGDINIAVFPNTFKNAENQPDMNITISFGGRQEALPIETAPAKNGKKKAKGKVEESEPPF